MSPLRRDQPTAPPPLLGAEWDDDEYLHVTEADDDAPCNDNIVIDPAPASSTQIVGDAIMDAVRDIARRFS